MKIGLISDTHGLLRTEAMAALAGCDHLLHAGNIGKPEILALATSGSLVCGINTAPLAKSMTVRTSGTPSAT